MTPFHPKDAYAELQLAPTDLLIAPSFDTLLLRPVIILTQNCVDLIEGPPTTLSSPNSLDTINFGISICLQIDAHVQAYTLRYSSSLVEVKLAYNADQW